MTWRRLAILAGSLAGIAIVMGFWILFTESGLRWSVRTAERLSGDSFSVQRSSGRIAGLVVLEGMSVDIPGLVLSVNSLRLRPLIDGLMRTTITIGTAEAEGLNIHLDKKAFGRKSPDGSHPAEPFVFPVKIDINNLSVRNLSFFTSESPDPVTAKAVSLSGRLMRDRAVIEHLKLDGGKLLLEMDGVISFTPTISFKAATSWSIKLPGDHRISGIGSLDGTPALIRTHQEVSEPFIAAATAAIYTSGKKSSWEIMVDIEELDPNRVHPVLPALGFTGKIRGRGNLDSAAFTGEITAPDAPGMAGEALLLELDGRRDGHKWELSRFDASVSGTSATIEASGYYASDNTGSEAILLCRWGNIHWPIKTPEPLLSSPSGELSFHAKNNDYRLTTKGAMGGAGYKPGSFSVTLAGSGLDLAIEEALFSADSASLTAKGTLSDQWDIAWKLTVPDLKRVRSSNRGQMDVTGILQGQRESPLLSASLQGRDLLLGGVALRSADGAFKLEPLKEMDAEINLTFTGVELENFLVDRFVLTGSGNRASHLFRAEMQSGSLLAASSVQGMISDDQWKGTISVDGLDGTISSETILSWADSLSWSSKLHGEGFKPALVRESFPEEISFEALFSGSRARGLTVATVEFPRLYGSFRTIPFEGSLGLSLLGERILLENANLDWGSARLRAGGALEEVWDVQWDLDLPDVGSFLDGGYGNINASGGVTGSRTSPVLTLSMNTSGVGAGELRSGEVSATAMLRVETGYPVSFDATIDTVSMNDFQTGRIDVTGTSRDSSHMIRLRTRDEESQNLEAVINGKVAGQTWNGSIVSQSPGGSLELEGNVSWKDKVAWQAQVRGKGMNPGYFLPEWPGKLRAGLSTKGSLDEGTVSAEIDLNLLEGVLRGLDVKGTASARWDTGESHLNIPAFEFGGASLSTSFNISDVILGSWALNVEDTSRFLPSFTGTLRSSGNVFGAASSPSVMASAFAVGMGGNGWTSDTLSVQVSINEMGDKPSKALVNASGISGNRLTLAEASLELRGTLREHFASLSANYAKGRTSAQLSGKYDGNSWDGILKAADLSYTPGEDWSLEGPAALKYKTGEAKIEPACLRSGRSRACIDASWEQGMGNLAVMLHEVPLSLFTPGEASRVRLEGLLGGEISGRTDGKVWEGTARLACPEGSILYPTGFGRLATLDFGGAFFSTDLDGNGLFGSFKSRLGSPGSLDHLNWELELPGLLMPFTRDSLRKQVVQGSLQANLKDMRILQALVPDLTGPTGTIAAALKLGGTLEAPVMEGNVSMLEGAAKVPVLGLSLENVIGRLAGDKRGTTTFSAAISSGRGRISADGSAFFTSSRTPSFQISLKGEDFTAARIPVLSLVISPDLLLFAEKNKYTLTGTVRIPEAVIKPKEIPTIQAPSQDVVVLEADGALTKRSQAEVYADLTLILDEDVTFEGFGLTGRISGSVRIIEEPGKITSATGDLTIIDGQYRAYGQKLTIERGKLIFSGGPVQNPGLDIRATRQVDDVVAGVQVGGTLMEPVVSLYSVPVMDQADALSYLLLGKPLRRTSGDEGDLLASAALSMGLNRGEALAGRIGKSFGLEEVTVQTEADVEESSLVVGRYLTPRVYVRYGVGIFQSFSLFQFGYRISDRFMLQGESGAQTGTDLFYTIDK